MKKIKMAVIGLSFFLMIVLGFITLLTGDGVVKAFGFIMLLGALTLRIVYKDESRIYDTGHKAFYDDNGSRSLNHTDSEIGYINPASGALMIDGMGSVDTFGNSYGSDVSGSFSDEIGGVER